MSCPTLAIGQNRENIPGTLPSSKFRSNDQTRNLRLAGDRENWLDRPQQLVMR